MRRLLLTACALLVSSAASADERPPDPWRQVEARLEKGDVAGARAHAASQDAKVAGLLQSYVEAWQLGETEAAAKALYALGLRVARTRDWTALARIMTRRAAVARHLGDPKLEADTLMFLGGAQQRAGRYAAALGTFEAARTLYEGSEDMPGVSMSLTSIASVHSLRGDHRKSLEVNRRALAVATELGHDEGIQVAQNNIAIDHQELGAFREALAAYREALAIARKRGDERGTPRPWAGGSRRTGPWCGSERAGNASPARG